MSERQRANPGQGPRLRAELLAGAEALLVESGTEEALTLRAVAHRVGVTTPSVYMHFSGKEALVDAVCLRAWDELGRLMVVAAAREDDPFLALGRSGMAYARFALQHPVQYRVLMMRPGDAVGIPPAAQACVDHFTRAVTRCVSAGVLRGDPEPLTFGLWSAVHGCVSLMIAQPSLPWPTEPDRLIWDVIRMAGFGSAIASRLDPVAAIRPSAELAEELDSTAGQIAWGAHDGPGQENTGGCRRPG